MLKYVNESSIKHTADYFYEMRYRKPEQIGLFLYFKAVGLNEYGFTSYPKWGKIPVAQRRQYNRVLYDLSAVFDASTETGLKYTSVFPFSIGSSPTYYNGATAFEGLGSRISDTLDNALVSSFILRSQTDANQLKLAPGYREMLFQQFLCGNQIPLELVAAWYYRFRGIDAPDGATGQDLQDACVLGFLHDFHISEQEFQALFFYGFSDNCPVRWTDTPITGPFLRRIIPFPQDHPPEVLAAPSPNFMPMAVTMDQDTFNRYMALRGEALTTERILEILRANDAPLIAQARQQTAETQTHNDPSRDQLMALENPVRFQTGVTAPFARNRIVFGAPGTGKSHRLEEDRVELLQGTTGSYERVTFHPEYTYSQFVGTYKPVTNAAGEIRYDFVPGPFMRVLVEALKSGRTDNPQPHLLLIEEINRAKVAAVFGEVFQLLDRSEDGSSEYEIHVTEDIKKYLISQLGKSPDNLKIPDNMLIWATMNSADQGVFPMDTAFKRRWNFEYIGIDDNDDGVGGVFTLAGMDINWNTLRKAINEVLAGTFNINEDKLLGPYFLSKKVFAFGDDGRMLNPDQFINAFKSKVIMYLYDDAAKSKRRELFQGCDSSKFSSVCTAFEERGIEIFGADFVAKYRDMEA